MNFKPLYVSLLALGLVSGSALAANDHVAKAQAVVDQNSAVGTVCTKDWTNRITLGGLLNVDALYGDNSPIFSFVDDDNHGSDIVVNNANVFVDATINSWTTAHMNLAYLGKRHDVYEYESGDNGPEYVQKHGGDLVMDEAYITIANFAKSPLYLRAGKQYVAFGDYTRYPMVKSLTQRLSQTNATAVAAGFVSDMGLYFNAYAFNGATMPGDSDKPSHVRNYGAKLGYYGDVSMLNMADRTHYNFDVSYIHNIYDVDEVYSVASSCVGCGYETVANIDSEAGLALHGDMSHGPFDFVANYVTAMGDLVSASDTRLQAGELTAGYAFQTMGHDSKVGLSYQWTKDGEFTTSWDASVLSVPKSRWMADYHYNVMKNTDLGVALVHDRSYPYEGTRHETNTGIARLSVQF